MNRYKQAREHLLLKLPSWKRESLLKDESTKTDSRIVNDFAKSVIELAESDKPIGDVTEKQRKPKNNKKIKVK